VSILGRLRHQGPVAPATWQPVGRPPYEWAPAWVADFEGSAGPNAFGVRFTLKGHPGATLTIWTYVAHGPSGSFRVGYRCDHCLTREPWPALARVQNGVSPEAWRFGSLADADDNARGQAAWLARTRRDETTAQHLAWCFAWDGEPW
jgi:hypothetical protein